MKFLAVFWLCFGLAFAAPENKASLPLFIQQGFEQYQARGAESALKTWVRTLRWILKVWSMRKAPC